MTYLCPICQEPLESEQKTDVNQWTYWECPGETDYYCDNPKDYKSVLHYRAIYKDSDIPINQVFYLERFLVEITSVTEQFLKIGTEVSMITPIVGMIAKCYGYHVEEQIPDIETELIFSWPDPTIFLNKSPEEMEKKIKLYLIFQ